MGRTFNVAVIGAGDMGGNHVQAWKLAGHEVVSVTDIDTVRVQELADKHGVPKVFSDYKEAVSQPEVDIVSICLPLAFHKPVTVYAAEQGKHVFCEKPLARSFEEAIEMEEACRKAGVQFGVGFQRNLSNSLSQVKKWAQEGKFGHPLVMTSTGIAMVRPKRAMHDGDGNMGPIMDNCCHFFKMWETIFGSKPKTIYACGGILAKDRPELAHIQNLAVDTGLMLIAYESGDIAQMDISWGMPDGFKMRGRPDRIYGPKGGAEGAFNSVTEKLTLYEGDQVEEVPIDNNQNLHEQQFRLFADAISTGKPAPISFEDGKEMLLVSLAILESIKTGKVIEYKDFK